MSKSGLLLAALLGYLWAVPAQANVIYNWVSLTGDGHIGGSDGPPVGLPWLGTLRFSDDVVASGHYSLVGSCHYGLPLDCAPGFYSHDFGDFSFAAFGGIGPILIANFTVGFNPDGTLSGITSFRDEGAEFHVGGSEFSWSGTFNSDRLSCYNPQPCQVTGYWQRTPIPEPSTWAMMLMGVGAACAITMKRRRDTRGLGA